MDTYEDHLRELFEDKSRLQKQASNCAPQQRQRLRNLSDIARLIAEDIIGRRGEIKNGIVYLNFSEDGLSRILGVSPGTVLEYLKYLGSTNVKYCLRG